MKIIPAILQKNLKDIQKDLENLQGCTDLVSIDLCDGKFVPSKTWLPDQNSQEDIFTKYNGSLEFDLMVLDPENYLNFLKKIGAKKIVIHSDKFEVIEKCLDFCHKNGLEIGLSSDNYQILERFAYQINYIQVMGIKKLGYQNQPFDENSLEKIKNIRSFYDGSIQIDGGLNIQNVNRCFKLGVNNFIFGSKIFGSGNPKHNYQKIILALK